MLKRFLPREKAYSTNSSNSCVKDLVYRFSGLAMDVADDSFESRAAIVDRCSEAFGYAVLVFGADCITSNATRQIILGLYILYAIWNTSVDLRLSIIRGLSLFLFWFYFYGTAFSLLSIWGVFLITKMALMTFGNAALWVTIPGVRFDTYSIVVGNLELATYLTTWILLSLISTLIKFLLSPLRELSPLFWAIIATVAVQLVLSFFTVGPVTRVFIGLRYVFSQNADSPKAVTAPTSEFTYSRRLISGMEIRLLKLYPGDNGDGIRCEVVHHQLERLLDYEAISYTWGNTNEKIAIVIDNQIFETSVKLAGMLRSLRYTWKPRMLWIDFMCINQDDTDEKSHQVQLMRHIYHRAVSVVMWLEPLPDTAEALDLLVEICRRTQLGGLTEQEGSYVYGQQSQRPRVLSLARFLANDYFNRLWVVQEIASARKIKVICGDQAIEWDHLKLILKFFGNPEMMRSLQRTDDIDIISCNQDSVRHGLTICYTKAYMSKGASYSLAYVLSSFRSFKCKDPRDKVFSLLGLIRSADHPLILPDYRKDEVQVYKDVARYIFTVEQTSRKLVALAVAGIGHYRRLGKLPSWVPDWASNMRQKHHQDEEISQAEQLPASNQNMFSYLVQTINNFGNSNDIMWSNRTHFETPTIKHGYRAALDTEPRIELIEHDIIGIKGFLVDEINSLTAVFDLPFDENMRISHTKMTMAQMAWFKEAEALVAKAHPHRTSENIEDIVWRTLIGDRVFGSDDSSIVRPAPCEYANVYREFKAAASQTQEVLDLVGIQVVSEVRDISLEILMNTSSGKSISELWLKILCGRSGHPEIWKLIAHGTKFAEGSGRLPDFPDISGDAQFWYNKCFEFLEHEDTRRIGARFTGLFQLFTPPNLQDELNSSQANIIRSPNEQNQHNTSHCDEVNAMEEEIFKRTSNYPQLVSKFSEGLRMSFERRLCLTKKGYVGLVPPLTEIGDRVCILFGGDAPYLIRPEEGCALNQSAKSLNCQLVGECYVHGMMDGEMMHLAGNDTWFHLK
ncbi:heterokaryon incompatibility protein-domain-containing protein [Camillea tinctor]|nr:heterokaryon incompatibility protein-domain-containing protein [Camillea tinctor]